MGRNPRGEAAGRRRRAAGTYEILCESRWECTWTQTEDRGSEGWVLGEGRQWPEVSGFVARFCTLRESENTRPCENVILALRCTMPKWVLSFPREVGGRCPGSITYQSRGEMQQAKDRSNTGLRCAVSCPDGRAVTDTNRSPHPHLRVFARRAVGKCGLACGSEAWWKGAAPPLRERRRTDRQSEGGKEGWWDTP